MKLKVSFMAGTLGELVAPGIFKIATPAEGDVGAYVILNNVPNQQLSENGGWNYIYTFQNTPDEVYTSKVLNPLYDASNPLTPQYVPANYATAADAVAAYGDGNGTSQDAVDIT